MQCIGIETTLVSGEAALPSRQVPLHSDKHFVEVVCSATMGENSRVIFKGSCNTEWQRGGEDKEASGRSGRCAIARVVAAQRLARQIKADNQSLQICGSLERLIAAQGLARRSQAYKECLMLRTQQI